MAHAASEFFPEDHLYVKSPAETAALIQTEVEDAQLSYRSSEDASYEAYAQRSGVEPHITLLDPASFSGAPGAACSLKVIGTGFTTASRVKVGGVQRTTVLDSPTQLTATFNAPGSTSTVDVLVENGVRASNVLRLAFTIARTAEDGE